MDSRDRKPGFGGRQGESGHEGKDPQTEPDLIKDVDYEGRPLRPAVAPKPQPSILSDTNTARALEAALASRQ
jgi:hypothetical protein